MASLKVTWEDQQRINSFGRFTSMRREIDVELETLREKMRTLEDASSEITLSDEGLKYRLGDCFVEIDGDAAEKLLEKEQSATKQRIAALEAQSAALKKELAELKVTLKQRFGDAIALDK